LKLTLTDPVFLAGLALLVLPLLAHLTGARTLRRVELPTVRFLAEAHRALRRRWFVDDLLLMLVRMAAVVALSLLFCRPTLLRPVAVTVAEHGDRDTVVVVDRSLSTRRAAADGQGTAFDRIRQRAIEQVEGTAAQVAVVCMDHRAEVLGAGLDEPRADLVERLGALEAGSGGTDLGEALDLAAELLDAAGVPEGRVVVLGDGTATSAPLEALTSPTISVTYVDVGARTGVNRWPAQVVVGEERPRTVQVAVTVAATTPDPGDVPLELAVEGLETARGTARVGEAKPFTVVAPPAGLVPATVALQPDGLPGDDALPLFLRGTPVVDVMLVGGEGGRSPRDAELYYLDAALEPGDGIRTRSLTAGDLDSVPAVPGTVVVLANTPPLPGMASELQRLLEGGAGVLMAVGSLVQRDAWNAQLVHLLPAPLGSVKSLESTAYEEAPLALAVPPLDEPLWAPFREGGRSTFGRVRFDRLMEVEPVLAPDSRVLLRYTDGRAALLERRTGPGRLLLFTSTLDDDWTDLPIRAVYLPIVQQIVRYLGCALEDQGGDTLQVGDPARFELRGHERLLLVGPEGPLDEVRPGGEGEVLLAPLQQVGHHRLVAAEGGEVVRRFCVRVDPAESALTPIDPAALSAVVPGLVHVQVGGDAGGAGHATVMRPTSLVPLAAALVLVALLGEGLLGRRR